jgi:hypothetical protein
MGVHFMALVWDAYYCRLWLSRGWLEPYVGSLSLYARWTHPQAVCPPSPPTAIVHFPHKPMPRVHWTSGPSARARTRAQFLGAVRVGIGPIASWGAIGLLGRGSVSVTAVVWILHI